MVHHYLQRGILPEQIINATALERGFYLASMLLEVEANGA